MVPVLEGVIEWLLIVAAALSTLIVVGEWFLTLLSMALFASTVRRMPLEATAVRGIKYDSHRWWLAAGFLPMLAGGLSPELKSGFVYVVVMLWLVGCTVVYLAHLAKAVESGHAKLTPGPLSLYRKVHRSRKGDVEHGEVRVLWGLIRCSMERFALVATIGAYLLVTLGGLVAAALLLDGLESPAAATILALAAIGSEAWRLIRRGRDPTMRMRPSLMQALARSVRGSVTTTTGALTATLAILALMLLSSDLHFQGYMISTSVKATLGWTKADPKLGLLLLLDSAVRLANVVLVAVLSLDALLMLGAPNRNRLLAWPSLHLMLAVGYQWLDICRFKCWPVSWSAALAPTITYLPNILGIATMFGFFQLLLVGIDRFLGDRTNSHVALPGLCVWTLATTVFLSGPWAGLILASGMFLTLVFMLGLKRFQVLVRSKTYGKMHGRALRNNMYALAAIGIAFAGLFVVQRRVVEGVFLACVIAGLAFVGSWSDDKPVQRWRYAGLGLFIPHFDLDAFTVTYRLDDYGPKPQER